MLNRFKSGLATPCWGNRYNIESLIRSETSHITDISVIGCGDIEMTRDQSTLFPVSLGGKTDIYIKTAPYSTTTTITLKANLQSIDGRVYTWAVIIPADALPGFWTINSIGNIKVEGELQSEENLSTDESAVATKDCFFTPYQSRIVTFTTPPVETELYQSMEFDISLYGCPYIDEIHSIVTKDTLKPVSSDVVVRAPIPCEVYTTIHLNAEAALSDEQQLAIQQAISTYINNTGFSHTLLVSEITPLIQAELTSSQRVTGIQLDGIILSSGLMTKRISSNQYLQIPDLPSEGITPKITAYYTRPEMVAFNYNTDV